MIKTRIKNLLKTNNMIYVAYHNFFSCLLSLLGKATKIDDEKILFVVFGGKRYDDSPREVYESMKEDPRFCHLRFVWAFEDPDSIPEVSRDEKVKIDTLEYFIEALTSKYWITNSSASRGLNFMKKETINIFFTHGMTGIKKMGADSLQQGSSLSKFKERQDYIVIEGKKEGSLVRRMWNLVDTELLPLGLPRNDRLNLYTSKEISEIKERFDIPESKKVILYAPTYREYQRDSDLSVFLAPPFNFDKWNKELGDQYVLLLTAHYEVEQLMNVPKHHPFIRNAFKYPHLNDLIAVSDLLISDYSSIIFDYSITGKPIINYAYDYNEYKSYRGLYDNYEELFFDGINTNETDLIEVIKNINFEEESQFVIKHIKEEYFQVTDGATDNFTGWFYETFIKSEDSQNNEYNN